MIMEQTCAAEWLCHDVCHCCGSFQLRNSSNAACSDQEECCLSPCMMLKRLLMMLELVCRALLLLLQTCHVGIFTNWAPGIAFNIFRGSQWFPSFSGGQKYEHDYQPVGMSVCAVGFTKRGITWVTERLLSSKEDLFFLELRIYLTSWTSVCIEVCVFWVLIPCNVAIGYRRFGGPYSDLDFKTSNVAKCVGFKGDYL